MSQTVRCQQCGKEFEVRFSFQRVLREGVPHYYCSQQCREPFLAADAQVRCSVCNTPFTPVKAFQTVQSTSGRLFFCSPECREQASGKPRKPQHRLAILNQKGGTGKTTTAINLAAGLALRGKRTLLIDLDPQGSVGVALGVKGAVSVYHLFVKGVDPRQCAINIRENLDLITSDESLAQAELFLARSADNRRFTVLSRALQNVDDYDYVLIDCAPAFSLLNQNALLYARNVLVPVSCDYLSLVGLHQVLKTVNHVAKRSGVTIDVRAVLPTFYDVRNNVSGDALKYLRERFGHMTLPPIRINVKLQEAIGKRHTVFEHAPDSNGARDYIRVVEWLINITEQAPTAASPSAQAL